MGEGDYAHLNMPPTACDVRANGKHQLHSEAHAARSASPSARHARGSSTSPGRCVHARLSPPARGPVAPPQLSRRPADPEGTLGAAAPVPATTVGTWTWLWLLLHVSLSQRGRCASTTWLVPNSALLQHREIAAPPLPPELDRSQLHDEERLAQREPDRMGLVSPGKYYTWAQQMEERASHHAGLNCSR